MQQRNWSKFLVWTLTDGFGCRSISSISSVPTASQSGDLSTELQGNVHEFQATGSVELFLPSVEHVPKLRVQSKLRVQLETNCAVQLSASTSSELQPPTNSANSAVSLPPGWWVQLLLLLYFPLCNLCLWRTHQKRKWFLCKPFVLRLSLREKEGNHTKVHLHGKGTFPWNFQDSEKRVKLFAFFVWSSLFDPFFSPSLGRLKTMLQVTAAKAEVGQTPSRRLWFSCVSWTVEQKRINPSRNDKLIGVVSEKWCTMPLCNSHHLHQGSYFPLLLLLQLLQWLIPSEWKFTADKILKLNDL